MAYANGRLPNSALAPIAGGRLRKDAAAAFNAMNEESRQRYGVTLHPTGPRASYRVLADQQYFWNLYLSGRGNLAARPGTSNHGWGLAVDLATPQMRSIVDKIGAKYGWAKKWSDAPSEWWHIRWRPGVWKGQTPVPTITKGSKNTEAIKQLQKYLRAIGFKSVRVNGTYGILTRRAVRKFQKAHGLHVDGVVGPGTWAKLKAKVK